MRVAFVRALTSLPNRVVDVSVTYSAQDSFVLILPPGTGTTRARVMFMLHTAKFGAHAHLMLWFTTSSASIATSQHDGLVRPATRCDFGAEIECLGRVTPNAASKRDHTARVLMRGHAFMLAFTELVQVV